MKKYFLLIFIMIFVVKCKEEKHKTQPAMYDDFIFSCSGFQENYSIKFSKSDTIFLQIRFPKPMATFYSILQNSDKLKLDSILEKIDFNKFDTLYEQRNLEDGTGLKFLLEKDSAINCVYIYGENGPAQFYKIAKWLRHLKEKQYFFQIDTTINFGNLYHILLPEMPPNKFN